MNAENITAETSVQLVGAYIPAGFHANTVGAQTKHHLHGADLNPRERQGARRDAIGRGGVHRSPWGRRSRLSMTRRKAKGGWIWANFCICV
jgi:hypothetical protein